MTQVPKRKANTWLIFSPIQGNCAESTFYPWCNLFHPRGLQAAKHAPAYGMAMSTWHCTDWWIDQPGGEKRRGAEHAMHGLWKASCEGLGQNIGIGCPPANQLTYSVSTKRLPRTWFSSCIGRICYISSQEGKGFVGIFWILTECAVISCNFTWRRTTHLREQRFTAANGNSQKTGHLWFSLWGERMLYHPEIRYESSLKRIHKVDASGIRRSPVDMANYRSIIIYRVLARIPGGDWRISEPSTV